ncbi:MAG TPA: thioredoxin family protein [Gemmatimonadaceae bacterium]
MANYDSGPITNHPVVSHEQWLAARIGLLEKEKAFSEARDAIARDRRALPWERVDKTYLFDGPNGKETLGDLFEGRRQLIVYHFMFAPEAKEGCPHCSFWADSFDVLAIHGEHLHQRDTTFVAISRATREQLDAFRRRMGWQFKWLSSNGTDFNYDYFVSFTANDVKAKSGYYNYRRGPVGSEREGVSVFYKGEDGTIFHTYSTYARGIDLLNLTYNFLDLTPEGRDEEHLDDPQAWVRHHDRYELAVATAK